MVPRPSRRHTSWDMRAGCAVEERKSRHLPKKLTRFRRALHSQLLLGGADGPIRHAIELRAAVAWRAGESCLSVGTDARLPAAFR